MHDGFYERVFVSKINLKRTLKPSKNPNQRAEKRLMWTHLRQYRVRNKSYLNISKYDKNVVKV